MKWFAAGSLLVALGFISAFAFAHPCSAASSLPQEGAASAPTACSTPEYRQFDFWLGDWDAFDLTTNAKDSRVRITPILDGCVIHEDYQSVDGHKGESFSVYDASRKVWHQTWVTNRGRMLVIEGRLEGDSMILRGADSTSDGHERLVRGIWKPVEGGVRETAYTSLDAGKTWKLWFDLIFRPHKG